MAPRGDAYSGAVPVPPPAVRRRAGVVGIGVAGGIAVLAGCSSSAPAELPVPSSAQVLTTPAPTATETLLPSTAPTGSTVGALADDFPADLVVVPAGAQVLVSATEPATDGDGLEIGLVLRSDLTTDALVEALRGPLLAAGFAETPATPEVGLAARTAFSRSDGAELLVLGVLDADGARTLTVGGTVRTAGSP